jgi:hypothetical protein
MKRIFLELEIPLRISPQIFLSVVSFRIAGCIAQDTLMFVLVLREGMPENVHAFSDSYQFIFSDSKLVAFS